MNTDHTRTHQSPCKISGHSDPALLLLFIYFMQMLYLAFISPMIYDFYNYHIEEPEFFQVFAMFTQVSNLSFEQCVLAPCHIC